MHALNLPLHHTPDPPAILSFDDAATIAGRSVSWVRKRLRFGQLVPAELDGRQAVETASLLDLMARRPPAKRKPQGSHLRLVVDNGP